LKEDKKHLLRTMNRIETPHHENVSEKCSPHNRGATEKSSGQAPDLPGVKEK